MPRKYSYSIESSNVDIELNFVITDALICYFLMSSPTEYVSWRSRHDNGNHDMGIVLINKPPGSNEEGTR